MPLGWVVKQQHGVLQGINLPHAKQQPRHLSFFFFFICSEFPDTYLELHLGPLIGISMGRGLELA